MTVTDLEKSAPWYQSVFDGTPQMEGPFQGGRSLVLADAQWQLMIGVSQHDANQQERFSETRTGLDHVGLLVKSRADLEAWQQHLEENGVVRAEQADRPLTQSPIQDESYGSLLTFRDPDNIQLHFTAPP